MSQDTVSQVSGHTSSALPTTPTAGSPRAFATGLFTLSTVLIVNTVLGPLGTEFIRYPISGTLLNQTIGLEAVTAGIVIPLTVTAGVLALRGQAAAALLGFGPAAFSTYMLVQHVLGPEYDRYTGNGPVADRHLHALRCPRGVGRVLAARQPVPTTTPRRRRAHGVLLLLLGTFILTRYLPVVLGGTVPPEFADARTFFWSIFLLDLGIVVPATFAAGIGLLLDAQVAPRALYALMGWYALVPLSVAARSATMVINDDPRARPAKDSSSVSLPQSSPASLPGSSCPCFDCIPASTGRHKRTGRSDGLRRIDAASSPPRRGLGDRAVVAASRCGWAPGPAHKLVVGTT